MFFSFFSKKKEKKPSRDHFYLCKHCKFTCDDCKSKFCFSCYVHDGNPCPNCGKTKKQADELKKQKELATN